MKVFIAGGGTGGHIYPGISIAQALQKLNPQIQIEFVGTSRGLEGKILPKAGYKLHLIQSGQLNFSGNILQKILTLLKIPWGIFQSIGILLKEKPDYVLGVGGYASAPFVLAASLIGKKTALWEPNAHPGMANRLLSKFVKKSFLVFEDAKSYLKTKENLVLGMPLRSEVEQALEKTTEGRGENERASAIEKSVDNKNKFHILCFGGSQGSVFLNTQLSDFVLNSPELHSKIQVTHQTGSLDFERIKNKYNGLACVQVLEYIYNMPDYYEKADLLFCRGGASTLAEAAAFGVVPLVVPLPAADDHQHKNAESLVQAKAGFLFIQKQFNPEEFKKQIVELMTDQAELQKMSDNLKRLAPRRSAEKIAQDILKDLV